ncbi:hypothetical protein ACTGY7_11070, partial [Streptococcus suis]
DKDDNEIEVSKQSLAFFYHDAMGDPLNERFVQEDPGLAHAMLGTMILVGIATLGAVPIGLLAAIFLVEYRRNPLTPLVRFIGELLGGVPSIVLGI